MAAAKSFAAPTCSSLRHPQPATGCFGSGGCCCGSSGGWTSVPGAWNRTTAAAAARIRVAAVAGRTPATHRRLQRQQQQHQKQSRYRDCCEAASVMSKVDNRSATVVKRRWTTGRATTSRITADTYYKATALYNVYNYIIIIMAGGQQDERRLPG